MNMNSRDRLILIVVLVIVVWVAGVMLFIKPAFGDVQTASQTLDAKEIELADLEKQIKEDEDLPQRAQDAFDTLNKTVEIFYPAQAQHEAMMNVQKLLDVDSKTSEQDIQNLDMKISTADSVDLGRYIYSPEIVSNTFDQIISDEADQTNVEIEPLELSAYSMSFNFTATKENLLTFFDNLQNQAPRSIVIDTVEVGAVGENENDTEWTGEITMRFIMVPTFPSPDDVDKLALPSSVEETVEVAAVEE